MRILIILLIIIQGSVYGQKRDMDKAIPWSVERPLNWDDFQYKAPKRHQASAMSDINFTFSVETDKGDLKVFIRPSFNPGESWVKQEDKSPELLKHEQLHFDIYEVNARKMRKEMSGQKLNASNLESKVNNMMQKYSELNVKTQERYDAETEHSIKKEKQEKWNEKIAEELSELKDFASPSFVVKMDQ